MAKMFYTLEEASKKLGLDAEAVKEMAASGKLQQFRDRDKLMFKREQIDQMAGPEDGIGGSSIGIPLADAGPDDTDAISLADSMADGADGAGEPVDPRETTGISVFDAGEVEPADPMAQTQVTQPHIDDEELALESVGSGSGLLDLTRESDDTSLGAELLDEIYPGSGDTDSDDTGASVADFGLESSVGSSGVFESALGMDTGTGAPSGLANLSDGSADVGSMDVPMAGGPVVAAAFTPIDDSDPAGSAMGAGLLLGTTVSLVIGLVVVAAALAGGRSTLTGTLVSDQGSSNLMFLCVGLLVASLLFGGVGFMIAKKSA